MYIRAPSKISLSMKKLLPVFLVLITFATFSQSVITNKKTSREISPGESHKYELALKAGEFCIIHVDQQGVDLLVKTFDASGYAMESFDSPNGDKGLEVVSLIATTAGKYGVEVKPLDEHQSKGSYTIQLITREPKATTPEKQIDQIVAALVRPGAPGATIAVAKEDKILFSKGYGSANPEYDIPNTPGTIFHIASVSKQFTAFAIAKLADEGKLSLDDDIRKYLTELNDFGHKITIRHLVHHTSGLRDQWNLLALAGWRLDDVITLNQVMRLMSNQKELNFKPGEEFAYCNTGYTFMAEIVSRVSGKPFAEYMAENVFKPLQMNNTLFYDDHEKIVKNRAYSFGESPSGIKKNVLSYANAGATSLFTTAEDLVKWSNNFYTTKVGNAKIMAQMSERGILNKGDTIGYAFGQGIGQYKGLRTVSHGGADAGYRSFLLRFPDQKYTIVVLSNYGPFNTGSLAYKIADIYLKDLLKEEAKPEAKKETPSVATTVSEEVLKRYEGQYELMPAFIISIRVENGKLVGQATGQPSFPLTAKTETEFVNNDFGLNISFQQNEKNEVHQLTLLQGGGTHVAPKLKAFDPSKVDLTAYVGTFYCPELETSYKVVIEKDKLVAKHIRHEPIELIVSPTKDAFSSQTWFMGQVVFNRNEKNEVTGLSVGSGRVRNVKFTKLPADDPRVVAK
jgi:CubicO group peptidase (beta-lactamase class C family)